MAALAPPRHRELARAMVAELDSIADPAERRRFAVGAMAALLRLSLSSFGGPNATLGDHPMPTIATHQLLRRHVAPFALTFSLSTALVLANYASNMMPQLRARGASSGTVAEAVLLAVPATVALTIPMAVLLAVLWVFTGLGRESVLAEARRERHGVRRLVLPVLGAAALIAALLVVSNTQILPRANGRLRAVLLAESAGQTERDMTVGELREAARTALTGAGPGGAARAAEYEVEVQKKFALGAACLFLALAGAMIALRFPRGGKGLVIGASGVVFAGYYLSLVAGEALADEQVISPFVAMWMPNAFLLATVLLLVWRPAGPGASRAPEGLATVA
jgi:lipopolysaccharide export LptBFGC system permease protein LptF